MGKLRVVTLLMAVACLVGLVGVTAGDSTGTQKRGWWTAGWQPVTQQKAAVKPNPAALAAKARLDSSSAKPWHVGWNEATGLPTGVSGESKQHEGSPTEIARQFIQDYRPLFTGVPRENDPGDIAYVFDTAWYDADPTRPATIVMYTESYKGVPVHLGGAAIHVSPQGRVIWAGGTLYHIDSLDVTPTLSVAAVIEALRVATAPDSLTQFGETPLLVWPGASPARLAYRISCAVPSDVKPGFYGSVFVDAHFGEVLGDESWMRLDPGPEYHRSGAAIGKDSNAAVSSDPRRHPAQKDVRIRTVPEAEWRAAKRGKVVKPDSQATPFDTTLPRPRSYIPSGEKKEHAGQPMQPTLSANGSSQPLAVGWFYSATFYHDQDFDYDGYDSRAIIEWDADTYSSALLVHVLIYGRDSYGQVVFLGQTPDYTIYQVSPDLYWTDVTVPWRSEWDFRLELADSAGNTLWVLDYGWPPDHGPALPLDAGMELLQEDAVYVNVTYDPPGQSGGTDWNNNGFERGTVLLFKVRVEYDSTYTLVAEVYAQDADSAGLEICIGNSLPFDLSYNNNQILGFPIDPFPGVHGRWDFKVNLYAYDCWSGCLLSSVPYGLTPGWTNVPLERWNEDGPLTTVFRPNPIQSLNDPSLWDEDDQLEAVPFRPQDGAYFSVSLSHLNPPVGGLYSLSGTYARIQDFDESYFPGYPWYGRPHVPPPTSADGEFPYLRDQPGFEAVMCYYFIDRNQTYVQALGFTQACNRQVLVDPHAFDGEDLSGYVVNDTTTNWGLGVVLYGDGGTDNAEDADDVLHEYGHAISDNLLHGIFARSIANQTRGMEEGFSDYWACSWADSFYPGPFPSAYFGEWEARSSPSDPAYMRRLNTTKHYPQDTTANPYENSEIWSACLWQMKEALGKRVTDSLCLRSFQLMRTRGVSNPTFLVGAQHILGTDTLAYAASHAPLIAQIFRARGILACDCPHQGDINVDLVIDVFDVIWVIGIMGSGATDPQDSLCPTTRGDVNFDGGTDVFDVIDLIAAAFSGGNPPINPCAP